MTPSALVDTGALLALLDKDDRWHKPCVEAFAQLRLPLLTSAAVLTELFHLLGDSAHEQRVAWRLLLSGAIAVAPIGDADLRELEALMERYADRPMDFADATLVHLATQRSLTTILTIDNNDFETYRVAGRRRFQIVPGRILDQRRRTPRRTR